MNTNLKRRPTLGPVMLFILSIMFALAFYGLTGYFVATDVFITKEKHPAEIIVYLCFVALFSYPFIVAPYKNMKIKSKHITETSSFKSKDIDRIAKSLENELTERYETIPQIILEKITSEGVFFKVNFFRAKKSEVDILIEYISNKLPEKIYEEFQFEVKEISYSATINIRHVFR